MKTNNTVINSIMNNEVNRTFMVKKSFLKYICAILLLVGTSAHAWGTGIYLEYNSNKYYDGQMLTINLAQTTLPAHGSPSMAIKNDAGWTADTYSHYGYITTTLSGTHVPSKVSYLMGSYTPSAGSADGDDHETTYTTQNNSAVWWNASFKLGYYFNAAGTYDVTMTVTEKDQADAETVLQSATITIRFVVTFSGYTITYNLTGLEHANAYNPTATSGEFHAEFELADNYSTPISGTYSDGFVTNEPITIGTSGDCYYNLGDLYYTQVPSGNVTINLNATLDCTPLAAPTGLTVTENKDGVHGKTRLSWNSVSNASSYKVVVTRGGVSGSETTTNTYYEYTFGTGDYTWKVRANGDGSTYCEKNDYANGSDFCVGADLSAVTPSNLAASSVTNTTATISWDAVANAAGYELLLVDGEETTIDDYSGSVTSWDITGLTAGTTYTIWWQAINSCDDEYNSNIDKNISFTTTNNHTVSFNANGGSGSMDAVVRTHGTTYDLPECTLVAPSGKVFKCWAEGSAGGTERAVGYTHTVNADITFYAKWRDAVISDYVFSCASLTLTEHLVTASTPIFITSVANKKVRSQDYITITGSGLTPNTPLTFPGLNSKFEVLTATGGTISTDANGAIDDVNAYIFYTPAADATTDGLDQMAGLTVSVGGAKPKQASLVQSIIGRHLPADFVIAAKNTNNNKWYALPADFSDEQTPAPIEIAVDDINNPSVAYTANTNIYNLYGQNSGAGYLYNDGDDDGNPDGEKIKLGMKNNGNKPLFAFAGTKSSLKGDGTATVTNNINKQYWWTLTQTATSIENPQDAKYTIASSNNSKTMSAWFNTTPQKWGLFAGGNGEHTLRLIPASDIVFTEAYFVEWSQHGGVIEVDATGIDATSVVAHLGEATSSAITLNQTLTSGKSRASKYNYTVNFGDGIDFAAAASNGAMLTLEWKNGATVKAMSNIVVPKIIASSATMSSINSGDAPWGQWEVHVLPGVRLTANAGDFSNYDVTIKHLEIYPGATVEVTKGAAGSGILTATTLVLRNGWSRAGSKAYDVARLYVTASTATLKASSVYADWYIDYDQYYPIAVPWNATVANFKYRYCSVEPSVGPSENIRMRYYDGASRATNVQEGVGSGANWKQYGEVGNLSVPTTLTPSTGYAMTAKRPSGKAFSIIRMPLTLPSGTWGAGSWTTNGESGAVSETHKDQVSVTAHGDGSTPKYAKGWNLIANPYMSNYQGTIEYADETKITYVNIPDIEFKEYSQMPTGTTKLKPASAFLIQAPETGTVTFGTANRQASAPGFRKETEPESTPEQQVYIVLNNEQSEDMMGILVSDKYTADYELNADLEKLLGEGTSLRTYMRYGDMNMAYVAINETLAKEWIPVNVRLPEAGEYTFSLHEASIAGELEGVYLIDYQNEDKITNLIEESYNFVSEAGTINGRFAINAIVGEHTTPTGIDAIQAGADINSDKPFKFIYRDKVYILNRGVIYDSTGKKVREINK